MKRPPVLSAVGSALAAVLLGACSGGSTTTSPAPPASPSPSIAALVADQVSVTGAGTDRVEMTFPVPSQADRMTARDISPGSGGAATSQSFVKVNYVGVGALTGKQFDSSLDPGKPVGFPLSGVIPGWQEGIPGMKPGGERVLVIPANLAYGTRPPPGSGIQPGETLVFYVRLLSIGDQPG